MSRNLIAAAILGLSLFASAGVQAQVSVVLPGNATQVVSLAVGTWTVSFNTANGTNACAFNLNGTPTADCSWEQAIGSVDANGNLSITFAPNPLHATPLTSLLSIASSSIQDLSVFELIANSSRLITSAVLSETGIEPSGNPAILSASETIRNGANTTTLGATGVQVANTGVSNTPTSSVTLDPQSSLFVFKDIKAQGSSGTAASVASVTQVFNVPEPASLSLLAIGFAGLLGLRRRRAQP